MKTILKIIKNELEHAILFSNSLVDSYYLHFSIRYGLCECMGMEFCASVALGFNPSSLTGRLLLGWPGAISSMQEHLFLYIPLLTMGLMSQEYNRGSIKLLYSSPVTNRQIIFGKYLSMIIYAAILVGILFIYYIFTAFTIKSVGTPLL